MKNYIFLLLLCLFFVFGCKKKNNPVPSTQTELWPLKVGNQWTYTQISYNSSGGIDSTTEFSNVITAQKTLSGNLYFEMDNSVYGPFFRNVDQNTVEAINHTGTLTFDYLKKVDSKTIIRYDTTGTNTEEVTAYPDIINIEGYSCYKVEDVYKDSSGKIFNKSVLFFSPGIGIVKTESYHDYKYNETILKSYIIK